MRSRIRFFFSMAHSPRFSVFSLSTLSLISVLSGCTAAPASMRAPATLTSATYGLCTRELESRAARRAQKDWSPVEDRGALDCLLAHRGVAEAHSIMIDWPKSSPEAKAESAYVDARLLAAESPDQSLKALTTWSNGPTVHPSRLQAHDLDALRASDAFVALTLRVIGRATPPLNAAMGATLLSRAGFEPRDYAVVLRDPTAGSIVAWEGVVDGVRVSPDKSRTIVSAHRMDVIEVPRLVTFDHARRQSTTEADEVFVPGVDPFVIELEGAREELTKNGALVVLGTVGGNASCHEMVDPKAPCVKASAVFPRVNATSFRLNVF